MGKWLILEAFNTRYADHRRHLEGRERARRHHPARAAWSTSTSCPIIGLDGTDRLGRAAIHPERRTAASSARSRYDTTRNELDAADSATEAYQPGIPDVPVHLYAVHPVPHHGQDLGDLCVRPRQPVPAGQGDRPAPEGQPRLRPDPATEQHQRADIDQPRCQPRRLRQGSRGVRTRTPPRPGARRAAAPPASTTARCSTPRPAGAARVRGHREPAVRGGADDGLPGRRRAMPPEAPRRSTATTASAGPRGPGDYIVSVDIPKTRSTASRCTR